MCKTRLLAMVMLVLLLAGCAGGDRARIHRELLHDLDQIDVESREGESGIVIDFPAVMLFPFDSYDIKAEARGTIRKLVQIVNKPKIAGYRILVYGYSDAIGDPEYNLYLSKKRATAVENEFVFNGVHKSRMVSKGFGEENPVAPNKNPDGSDNPAGRSKNRRVEVIIETSAAD